MYVAPGNESYATEEVMKKVKRISEKIEKLKQLREEIIQLAQDDDLWHLHLEYEDITQVNVEDKHERWLASNHNC